MKTQGERIKNIRLCLHLSQDKFGEGLGITRQFVSNVEKDRSVLSNEKLASILLNYNVNVNYILTGKGEPFLTSELDDADEDADELEQKIQKVVLKMKAKGLL